MSKLVGADPENLATLNDACRETPNNPKYADSTFLLLNVRTEKFFNIGGAYGRHASLSNTGMYLWIWKNSTTQDTYNIRTLQNYVKKTETVDNQYNYVQYYIDSKHDGVYLDCLPSNASYKYGWKFEQADGYDAQTNKIYKISTYGDKDGNCRYLTATPDDPEGNFCNAISETPQNSEYQLWKLITLKEYYELFNASPSDLSSPIDATFLIQNPGFNYNRSNSEKWLVPQNPDNVRFGVEGFYKKKTENYYKGEASNNDEYLYKNGKYFCGDIKERHNTEIHQLVTVDKAGWYIVRCNGFSNTNGLAKLFVNSFYVGKTASTTLNPLEANGPKDLLEAGKEFYNDKYENEVMIHLTTEDLANMGGFLIIGIKVENANTPATGEWTAFDNFRLLYAGESTNAPDLVLDENNPDLRYLTETIEEYKNCILHLNRSFELNKWNTLILPVNLTYGQMRYTFGDEVKLAKLYKLTPNSVRFKTVECDSDNDVMLEAFTPYIIKPTKAAGENPAYMTPRLKNAEHGYWLDENESISYAEEGIGRYTGGKVSIKANHYDIQGVTLDRTLLNDNLDKHWVSKYTTSTTATDADNNKMVCKGTMAKTFYIKDGKGYFYEDEGVKRDDLHGDYFMNKGTMYKVPANKQYGLKAFRCWFELTNTTDKGTNITSPAKDVKLFINEIEDETTGIGDIITDPAFSHVAYQYDGVYNLQGQLVRQGTSLEGLPQGIYIVKGKKVKR
ncbi:hypothetical protein [Segatella hominis]|uniref:Uncharacterized protein n=1 Tax=Segatella hominis TaxID=2518605 RepID=A0A4Y8VUF4_9BACT|nr:hypothetical protein [Segatella hominis]TFH84232.1 hypothetical protein EXN75_02520 [Segatella hominis]